MPDGIICGVLIVWMKNLLGVLVVFMLAVAMSIRNDKHDSASEDNDELLISTLDPDMIEGVRKTWPLYRDRRPETYAKMFEI